MDTSILLGQLCLPGLSNGMPELSALPASVFLGYSSSWLQGMNLCFQLGQQGIWWVPHPGHSNPLSLVHISTDQFVPFKVWSVKLSWGKKRLQFSRKLV